MYSNVICNLTHTVQKCLDFWTKNVELASILHSYVFQLPSFPVTRAVLGGMLVFEMLLTTDFAISGIVIIIPTIGVVATIVLLKKRVS